MDARIFSSVLLPEPLRPTMPKNSPSRTSKLMSRSARSSRCSTRAHGRVTRSLSESIRWSGMRKVLLTPRASMTTDASIRLAQITGAIRTLRRPVIAFGAAITKPDVYRRHARRGIDLVAGPDAVVVEHPSAGTLFEAYNAILDEAAGMEGLEALVLLHQDAEIVSPDFCQIVRRALADPDVGLVGCAGAIGVRSIAWWEGSVTCASFVHRYDDLGGGELPAFSWDWSEAPPYARLGEVETLDGFLLVLSPWVVAN